MKTLVAFLGFTLVAAAQGPLTPPGAPAPTMKTLEQVEPRTPVSGAMTISRSGSYYLTTNLVIGPSMASITVSTNNVTLDLNGFTIIGSGTGSGILVFGARTNIVLKNGFVRGFADGVSATTARYSQFENLVVTANTNDGIAAGDSAVLVGCVARLNGGDGISVGIESQIVQCTATTNGGNGIVANSNSKLSHCFTRRNNGDGIFFPSTTCTVDDCRSSDNTLSGIRSASGGHILRNCAVESNGERGIDVGACCNIVLSCIAGENGLDGIRVSNSATVSDNISRFNGSSTNNGAGIRLVADDNHVEHNHVLINDLGIAAPGSDNVIIRNDARSNTTNYFTIGTQIIGPIINSTGTITNVNPWANFSF